MNYKLKFVFKVILVLFLITTFNVKADINEDDNWIKMGGNNTNSKVISSDTIKSAADIGKKITVSGGFRDAIIIDNLIYVVNGKPVAMESTSSPNPDATLEIYDLNGVNKKKIPLNSEVGFFSRLTYDGENTVFVSLKTHVQAIDIDTMESLWISETSNKQMLSQLVYHDGYLYGGVAINPGAGTNQSDGYYFAIDTDPSKDGEQLPYAWTWKLDDVAGNGFYWDGAAIVNDAIVFVGDGGKVVSHALKSVDVYDEYELNTPIDGKPVSGTHKVRSLVYYDETKKELLIATQNSKKIFKIPMNGNKFDKDNIKVEDTPDQISGGINIGTDNNLYLSSGGMNGNAFSIYDAETLERKFSTKDYGTQSFPLINVAKTDGYEYTYFIDYGTGNMIICKYNGQSNPSFESIVLPNSGSSPRYNSGSVIAAKDGTLVATKHDGGPLFIIKNKSTYEQTEVDKLNLLIQNYVLKGVSVDDYKDLKSIIERYTKLSEEDQKKVIDYNKFLKTFNSLNDKTETTKSASGKTTYHYKFKVANGQWFNYKTEYESTSKSKITTKTTTTYNYSSSRMKSITKKPLNGSIIAKKTTTISKPGVTIQEKTYYYNSKGNLTKLLNYKINKNYKRILINKQTKSYYSNGKLKNHYIYNKSLTTNKYTSKERINNNSQGKKVKRIKFYYSKGKTTKRLEYAYNKNGDLKTNSKYGKAYRYTTTYKNGKAKNTIRQQYNSKGKLAKKSQNVKLRKAL